MTKTGRDVAKQLEGALNKLAKDDDGNKKADDISTALDLTALDGLSKSESILNEVAADRGQDVLASLDIPSESDFFDHTNIRAAAYAKSAAAELVRNIDEATRNMLRSKIAAGLDAHLMREDIIDSIIDSDIFSEKRATLIADTEVAMANGQGALAGYKEARAAGVKLKKIWVTDNDPCDECQENADAGPIGVDDVFPSGDYAETAHPGCKCHTESVVEDDDDEGDE